MDLRGSGFIILRNKAKKLFSFSSTGRDLGRTKPKRSSSCNLFFSTLIGFRADVAQRVSVSLAESQSQGHGIAELMSSAAALVEMRALAFLHPRPLRPAPGEHCVFYVISDN